YSRTSYRSFLRALEELGLIAIGRSYQPTTGDKRGECKYYFITPLCDRLLLPANLEWFKKLHVDKDVKRQIQKRISKSKVCHWRYDDKSLQVVHDLLIGLEFDYEAALKRLEEEYPTLYSPYTLHYVVDKRDNSTA